MSPNDQPRHPSSSALAATGVPGLDNVLAGGLTTDRLYLVEGVPGSGKTTLALQFLIEGDKRGERGMYVTLSESEAELRAVAASHDWNLDGIAVRELIPTESSLHPDDNYSMFHPSEVELGETTKLILAEVERLQPTRLAFDSLSELRLLAGNPLRFRRQILALKQFFAERNCTVLLLDDLTTGSTDQQVQSIAHGVVRLEQLFPEFGAERRRLIVLKYRGAAFRGGYHDYIIRRGGLEVFSRLVAGDYAVSERPDQLSSGLPQIDHLLGGGLDCGTSTLIIGAAGTGKSTLTTSFVATAAKLGKKSALFVFDESIQSLTFRCASLGIDLAGPLETGLVTIQRVDPAELSPGQLTQTIKGAVEDGASIVVIDSLNGYLHAMPGERFLIIQLHELLTYLGQAGVCAIMVGAQQGLIGSSMTSPIDASYLADTVVLLRYFEMAGEVRQAISVLKKRTGKHERTIRELRMDARGITVGEPLREFRGVLTGVPVHDASMAAVRKTEAST